jgi:hypothetical protein
MGVKLAGHKEGRDNADINQVNHKYGATITYNSIGNIIKT